MNETMNETASCIAANVYNYVRFTIWATSTINSHTHLLLCCINKCIGQFAVNVSKYYFHSH